ncbi:MAG: hypothetical protein HKP59_04705 [Lutibacter sp.]|uniref:hypothetical protein n=1 Tax=Lutibacter sp. TaxID=1925666 RepID=UPI0017B3C1C0|nr:hypothetical protein [Lutibacter sp.]MBT8316903.1 hypothetical protein [Lutibacter sp.]NNJ57762.1 hypothetical protein [Lutibacter sp.]
MIYEEETLKKRLIRILGIESNPNKNINQIIHDSIFKSAVWDLQSDQPTFNTYNNYKNTNELSLIKNKNIKEKFTNLEFHLNKLNDIPEDRLSVHQIRIDDILEKDINFIPLVKPNIPEINILNEIENDYYELLRIKRIRNLLGMKLTFTQDVIDKREDLGKEIRELIVLLKNEISE